MSLFIEDYTEVSQCSQVFRGKLCQGQRKRKVGRVCGVCMSLGCVCVCMSLVCVYMYEIGVCINLGCVYEFGVCVYM